MVEEFFIKLDLLLARRSRPTDHECIQWTGKLDKWGYGTVQLRMPDGTRRHSTAHRAAYMLKIKCININKHDNLEVSHLCHHTSCVNPEHLVLEPRKVNLERKMCRTGTCIGHSPECMTKVRSIKYN